MKIFKTAFFVILWVLFVSNTGYAADDFKIGVVDFQKILNSSSAGKNAQNEIKKKGEALKSELEKAQTELKEMQEQYKRESLLLSDDKKKQKEREMRIKLNNLSILQNKTTKEFNTLKAKLINDVKKEVIDLAITKGQADGYELIIEKNSGSVLYAKNSLDLTDEMIQDYDKKTTPKK